MADITIITTGGTIDKVYFDDLSEFAVGESEIPAILRESNLTLRIEIRHILRKDSLDLTAEDRELIAKTVSDTDTPVVVTHGTDTMIDTAKVLLDWPTQQGHEKAVVLTGSLTPARFRKSDAGFNVAAAITAAQTLPPGVYIAMNGRIFDPREVRKNRDANCFQAT